MAIVQLGFLGKQGPVFVDDAAVPGKFIIIIGELGTNKLVVKQPAYAGQLQTSTSGPRYKFPKAESECTLGPYSDNQQIGNIPAYKQPASGTQFDYYENVQEDWVAVGAPTPTAGGGSGAGSGGSGSGGSGSGGSGSGGSGSGSSGGVITTTDTTYKAPTIGEQISTFLSNYWWLVLLIAVALLWKPLIAPALGLSKKRRSYR
jgi:hypothetical protein